MITMATVFEQYMYLFIFNQVRTFGVMSLTKLMIFSTDVAKVVAKHRKVEN